MTYIAQEPSKIRTGTHFTNMFLSDYDKTRSNIHDFSSMKDFSQKDKLEDLAKVSSDLQFYSQHLSAYTVIMDPEEKEEAHTNFSAANKDLKKSIKSFLRNLTRHSISLARTYKKASGNKKAEARAAFDSFAQEYTAFVDGNRDSYEAAGLKVDEFLVGYAKLSAENNQQDALGGVENAYKSAESIEDLTTAQDQLKQARKDMKTAAEATQKKLFWRLLVPGAQWRMLKTYGSLDGSGRLAAKLHQEKTTFEKYDSACVEMNDLSDLLDEKSEKLRKRGPTNNTIHEYAIFLAESTLDLPEPTNFDEYREIKNPRLVKSLDRFDTAIKRYTQFLGKGVTMIDTMTRKSAEKLQEVTLHDTGKKTFDELHVKLNTIYKIKQARKTVNLDPLPHMKALESSVDANIQHARAYFSRAKETAARAEIMEESRVEAEKRIKAELEAKYKGMITEIEEQLKDAADTEADLRSQLKNGKDSSNEGGNAISNPVNGQGYFHRAKMSSNEGIPPAFEPFSPVNLEPL